MRDARDAGGRLHHLAFWVDTREECLRAADLFVDNGVFVEAAPSKHGVAQGFFLYGFEPGGNRIEVTTGGYMVYDPDHEPVIWSEAERARGQFWGVKTVESFHYYGTPPTRGRPRVRAGGRRGLSALAAQHGPGPEQRDEHAQQARGVQRLAQRGGGGDRGHGGDDEQQRGDGAGRAAAEHVDEHRSGSARPCPSRSRPSDGSA